MGGDGDKADIGKDRRDGADERIEGAEIAVDVSSGMSEQESEVDVRAEETLDGGGVIDPISKIEKEEEKQAAEPSCNSSKRSRRAPKMPDGIWQTYYGDHPVMTLPCWANSCSVDSYITALMYGAPKSE